MPAKLNISRRKFISAILATLLAGFNLASARENNSSAGARESKTSADARENKSSANNASANVASLSSNARLGINLAGIKNYATELPFVDLFRMSAGWVSQRKKGKWGDGPSLALDEHGWLKRLEPDCFATAIVCGIKGNHYPSGNYTVLYDGEGELAFRNAATNKDIVSKSAGKIVVKVNANAAFHLEIISTNPQNYIKNIRVIMPGFESDYAANPWHPQFIKRWSGIACIRLMDFMMTNNSTQVIWDDRPKLSDASFVKKGVPLELMLDLANRLEADPWFCMPHLADDAYIKQFAMMVKANLKPNLRAWVEYSNEVWNNGFKQTKYANQKGQELSLLGQSPYATAHYYAHQSIQIFDIWQAVYGGHSGFVRVLATQAANAHLAETILSYKNAAKQADVLAIAPYVTVNISPRSKGDLLISEVQNWNLDQLFAHIFTVAMPKSQQWMQQNKKIADEYGLKLVAYESGQHLAGALGTENNDAITKLFTEANADPRIGEVYSQNLNAWAEVGGDLNCSYNSVSKWSKWGSWGLLQYYDEAPNAKFKAVMEWAKLRGQKVRL